MHTALRLCFANLLDSDNSISIKAKLRFLGLGHLHSCYGLHLCRARQRQIFGSKEMVGLDLLDSLDLKRFF